MKTLEYYIQKWDLTLDKPYFKTNSSIIQPCIYKNIRAILKLPFVKEELNGIKLMQWWQGVGADRVLEIDENALLMQRVENIEQLTLTKLVEQGDDTKATKIICQTAKLLHTPHNESLPTLIPLKAWFSSFLKINHFDNEVLKESAIVANTLLSNQKESCVLHGDLHHENILYSDIDGWVAIDPKGLFGDRAFDFANIVCNPNKRIALEEERLAYQLSVISEETAIEYNRLLDWVIAWIGLSATWMQEDGLDPSLPFEVGKLALKLKKERAKK